MDFDDYHDRFATADVTRDDQGVVTVRMHSKGGPLKWGGPPHQELPELFNAIASDRDVRVVILTGTGDSFITLPDGPNPLAEGRGRPTVWDRLIWEGNRLVDQMLAIEVPMIAAVNGPVTVHSELAVLCDIVLAAEHTYFQDAPHFPGGLVPGDSMQVVWPMLLGPNRGRYFLLTGQELPAAEAKDLGGRRRGSSPPTRSSPEPRRWPESSRSSTRSCSGNTRHVLVRPIRRAMADDLHTGLALEAIAGMSAREWYRDHPPGTTPNQEQR